MTDFFPIDESTLVAISVTLLAADFREWVMKRGNKKGIIHLNNPFFML